MCTRQMASPSHESSAERSVPAQRGANFKQESARKEQRMSYTSHDFLDAARRAIPEVSVEAVSARESRWSGVC